MQADEKARIEAQRTVLGETGLKRKGEEFENATDENEASALLLYGYYVESIEIDWPQIYHLRLAIF